MGLVLDTDVLIAVEREGKPVSELLEELQQRHGDAEVVLSVISVVELEHGVFRARTPEQAQRRRTYLDTVFQAVPVEPLTSDIARIAAKTDAEAKLDGRAIPFSDLLIGATALYFNYSIVTRNQRHFGMIPGLRIIQP